MNRPKKANKQLKRDFVNSPHFSKLDLKMATEHQEIEIFEKVKKSQK